MKLKDFQDRVIASVAQYLDELVAQRERSAKIAAVAAADPELGLEVPDFTAKAWGVLAEEGALPASRAGVPFSPRKDGAGRPAALASARTLGAVRQIAEKIVKKLRGDTVRNAGNTAVDA